MGPVIGDITQLYVDPNNAETVERAHKLVTMLVTTLGVEQTVSLLILGTHQVLAAILHAETPMPEANVASVRRLLDGLVENVMAHETCAMRDVKKETIQ